MLEPVCCKKQEKKVTGQEPLENMNGIKLILALGKSLGLIHNQFGIIQVLQSSPIPQTSKWS